MKRSTDTIQLIPARAHLLIAQVEAPNQTASGLFLSGGMQRMQMFAKVLRVGLPELDMEGQELPVDYEVGQIVMIPRPSNPRTGEPLGHEPWMKAEGHDSVMVIPESVIIAQVEGYEDAPEGENADLSARD